ncbi:MAG: AAA family ATPase [Proteobacteria bacterium]|nr:AAA family ATPase [Pseudomonadota bacterium]
MYKKFFGFKERPFQLVPNPAYLYLSKCHEEALAHLTYAISQGDGFVEIVGEVGTGKTTLCRVFLESLNTSIEAAYIFNPKLDSIQLLKAVNDDFGIDSKPDNIKDLIDILNRFLMKKKSEGKRIIILIDEAQNLTSEVLEQLRLLSNLETTTSKLIQIILVGQPELGNILDSYELRQLGQRITLSCQLLPLSLVETLEYIRHRLYVASGRATTKFTSSAIREVYGYSRGIPRLINIVCDRALLTAYVLGSRKITRQIVVKAIRELGPPKKKDILKVAVPIFCTVLFLASLIFFFSGKSGGKATEESTVKELVSPPDMAETYPIPNERHTIVRIKREDTQHGTLTPVTPDKKPDPALEPFSRRAVLQTILRLWDPTVAIADKLDTVSDDSAYFNMGSKMNGFSLYQITDDFSLIFTLNLPFLGEFYMPGYDEPLYMVLTKVKGDTLTFDNGNGTTRTMSRIEADQQWTGLAFVPWKNFLGCTGTIPGNAPEESVTSLKMLLLDLGYEGIELNGDYDETTAQIVMEIQKKNGIKADGIVEDLTKILLYNEKNIFSIPFVTSEQTQKKPMKG